MGLRAQVRKANISDDPEMKALLEKAGCFQ
jgi:N-acetylglutamate synthase-like GNAT family acetyltransferase